MTGCRHGHPSDDRYRRGRGDLACRGCDRDRTNRASALRAARRATDNGPWHKVEPRTSWLPRAGCRDADPDEFDVGLNVSGSAPPAARIDAMWDRGKICESCPVLALCARDAIAHDDVAIVRAGVPIVANADLAWRKMERSALAAMAATDDPPATRRTWRQAAHRTSDRRRAERKAKQAAA